MLRNDFFQGNVNPPPMYLEYHITLHNATPYTFTTLGRAPRRPSYFTCMHITNCVTRLTLAYRARPAYPPSH